MSEPVPREPADPPRIRASDADRERVADVVRTAVGDGQLTLVEGEERLAGVYGAVHRGELVAFTRDLTAEEPMPVPARRASAPAPVGERPATTVSVAVMSGSQRRGDWTPGRQHTAFALMGGVELDLRHARLGGEELTLLAVAIMGGVEIDLRGADIGPGGVTVQAFALMGGVEIVVDEHTRVDEGGIGFMGAFDDEAGPSSIPTGRGAGPRARRDGRRGGHPAPARAGRRRSPREGAGRPGSRRAAPAVGHLGPGPGLRPLRQPGEHLVAAEVVAGDLELGLDAVEPRA